MAVLAEKLDHLDLSIFHRTFCRDVRRRQVKNARLRYDVRTTYADLLAVANFLTTPPVFIAGRSSTWDPSGCTDERTT